MEGQKYYCYKCNSFQETGMRRHKKGIIENIIGIFRFTNDIGGAFEEKQLRCLKCNSTNISKTRN